MWVFVRCALVCDVTLGRRRKFFCLRLRVRLGRVVFRVPCWWSDGSGDRDAIRDAGDLLEMGVETREIKSDANERSSWFVIYCLVWVCCVCACVCEHFQCICGGSRLAGTSLANCYRNNNISIMYSLYISAATLRWLLPASTTAAAAVFQPSRVKAFSSANIKRRSKGG